MANETNQHSFAGAATSAMPSESFYNYAVTSPTSSEVIYSNDVQMKDLEQASSKDIFQQKSSTPRLKPLLEEDGLIETSEHQNEKRKLNDNGPIVDNLKYTDKNVSFGHLQPWSIAFTVIGTVLLDFCSDACQSPSRTYLLDVTIPEDHAAGLSTFTLMAGLGGSVGYFMGAVHWENTAFGKFLGGQVSVVFLIVTIVFVICLVSTICSFPEIPLPLLKDEKVFLEYQTKLQSAKELELGCETIEMDCKRKDYGSTMQSPREDNGPVDEQQTQQKLENAEERGHYDTPKVVVSEAPAEQDTLPPEDHPTLKQYLRSIIHMPNSLRVLCLTNLFSWMSLVCYSLYFTDFVGECVYGGDPAAPEDSEIHKLFKDGVQFGCFGMALYSISCSFYSYFIEALVEKFGAKRIYTGGHLVYSVGMVLMAVCRHPAAVILLSPTAGVMYSTLFTMPYLLIAHYHCSGKFREDKSGPYCGIRGIGTDVAAVSSMVFLSQFILSLSMGSIVELVGSNVATVCASAILSSCGAISATQVLYLDM
ncbi:proton-associated sugar transporter A-like [Uloborus diversus]|uniref:proton-associated sugar transporter A-like n=1 Tax=Uloborus diversus TaxID=327109 RepID=UPI00240A51E7|nr:proton-associated sugar transporter A-like [Uloborus diversus]